VKDLIDLALIAATSTLTYGAVRDALEWTFARRATHPMPLSLPVPPSGWATSYATLAHEIGLETAMTVRYGHAALCLDPVLNGTGQSTVIWRTDTGVWTRPPS
jgi:hypothetical protein